MIDPFAVNPATGLPQAYNMPAMQVASAALGMPLPAFVDMATSANVVEIPQHVAMRLLEPAQMPEVKALPGWRTAAATMTGIFGVASPAFADDADPIPPTDIVDKISESAMDLSEGILNVPWETWGQLGLLFGGALFADHLIGNSIKTLKDRSEHIYGRDDMAASALRSVRWIIRGAAAAVGMSILGVDFGNVFLNLGIPAAIIGWGCRDVVNNFAATMLIVFRGHVDVGDFIRVDKASGYVRRIKTSGVVLESRNEKGERTFYYVPPALFFTNIPQEVEFDEDAFKTIREGHYVSIGGDLVGRVSVITDTSVGIEQETPDGLVKIRHVQIHEISPESFRNYGFEPPRLPFGVGVGSKIVLDGKRGEVTDYDAQYVYLLDEDGTMLHRISRGKFANTFSYIDAGTRKYAPDEPENIVYPHRDPNRARGFIPLRKASEMGDTTPRVGANVKSFADVAAVGSMTATNMVELKPDKFPADEKLITLDPESLLFKEVPENMSRLSEALQAGGMTAQVHMPSKFDMADGATRRLSIGSLADHELLLQYFEALEGMRAKYGLAEEMVVTVHPPYEILNYDFQSIVAEYSLAEVLEHGQIDPEKKRAIEKRYLRNANAFFVRLGRMIEENGWKIKVGVENQAYSSRDSWNVGDKTEDFQIMMAGTSDVIQLTFDTGHSLLSRGRGGELKSKSLIYFAMLAGKHIASYHMHQNEGWTVDPATGTYRADRHEPSTDERIPGFYRFHLQRCALEGTSATLEIPVGEYPEGDMERLFTDIHARIDQMRIGREG